MENKMNKFVAMYVDVGDGSDNRPRVLGVYDTKEEAVREIIKDMYGWVEGMNPNGNLETEVNECRMIASVGDNYCYWNIEEVQM